MATMATTFEQLQELLLLSGAPVGTGNPDQWLEAQRRLGMRFPVDYQRFVSTYGYCTVDDGVYILNPFEVEGQFWEELGRQRAIDEMDLEVTPPDDPGAFYPRPKGMVPWGSTSDGGSYLWVTDSADPDHWTVFVEWDLSSAPYAVGFEDFLLSGLRSQLDDFAFGEGFPSSRPAYVDPVVSLAQAHVRFTPPVQWGPSELAIMGRVFGVPVPSGVNRLVVRPSRWALIWHHGHLTLELQPQDIDQPKAHVAALTAALGVEIEAASPDSWADLVS
jgi:hypothetical protein